VSLGEAEVHGRLEVCKPHSMSNQVSIPSNQQCDIHTDKDELRRIGSSGQHCSSKGQRQARQGGAGTTHLRAVEVAASPLQRRLPFTLRHQSGT
jgi:hypothetical protein